MVAYLFEMFTVSLCLTIILELLVACFWGMNRHNLLLAVLVNILTNPPAVLLHWLGLPQIPIETVVFAVEAYIYLRFSKDDKWNISHPVWFALVANGFSWLTGVLIQWLGG